MMKWPEGLQPLLTSLRLPRLFWSLLCLILFVPPIAAQHRQVSLSVGEATVLEVRGRVEKIPANLPVGGTADPLLMGAGLNAGDRLRAYSDGYALLGLVDGSTIEVQPYTNLEILGFSGGLRQLFRIYLGKVRIQVRKLVGAPNPYEMHSPIATIGVRGTEFEIDVRRDQVTTVRVYEGLVAVKNNQIQRDEVLVGAGKSVTVYPLRPPDPPVTFEQVVAENFSRESSVEQPLLQQFTAFPDAHLDLAENPAYASAIVKPSGRFYLYPARSAAFASPEVSPLGPLNQFTDLKELFATDERELRGISSRVSYVYPTDHWVFGGLYEYRGYEQDFRFRISRKIPSAFGGDVSVEQIGSSPYAPDLQSDTGSHRMTFFGARRFRGKTVAVSYDWTHTGGDFDSLYEFRPAGMLLASEQARTLFSSDRRQVTLGYHMERDGLGSLGTYYRFGFLNGNTAQGMRLVDGEPADLASFNSSGQSQEFGGRWRKRVFSDVRLALIASVNRTSVDERVLSFRTSDSIHNTVYWTPTLGGGLGYTWQNRLFAAFDYQYSQARSRGTRLDLFDSSLAGAEQLIRRSHGIHAWAQYRLPWDFFVGGGGIGFWAGEDFSGSYNFDSLGQRTDFQGRPQSESLVEYDRLTLKQVGLSLGKRFDDRLFLEYELLQTRAPTFSPLGHSLLLRFAF
jgi:hypothetical protein